MIVQLSQRIRISSFSATEWKLEGSEPTSGKPDWHTLSIHGTLCEAASRALERGLLTAPDVATVRELIETVRAASEAIERACAAAERAATMHERKSEPRGARV